MLGFVPSLHHVELFRGSAGTYRGLPAFATWLRNAGRSDDKRSRIRYASKLRAKRDHNQSDAWEGSVEGRNGHWTLSASHQSLLEVKKSKFIARAWHITSVASAMHYIGTASDPSASHNCFAYQIGDTFRSSDDGEPSGTAGRPMLAAIQSEGLDEVCVLVTRFFGGTKLGAGGLSRAYGSAARLCLQEAERIFKDAKTVMNLKVPFEDMGAVFTLVDQAKADRLQENYDMTGNLHLKVAVLETESDRLAVSIRNATSGRVQACTALTCSD